MAWLNIEDIRTAFDIPEADVKEGKMQFAVNSALSEVGDWISEADYTAVSEDTAGTDKKIVRLCQSQAWLTKAYLCDMGVRIKRDGGLKQAQDAGSPATHQTITNQFLSPKELGEEAAKCRSNAENLAKPYFTLTEVVEITMPVSRSRVVKNVVRF